MLMVKEQTTLVGISELRTKADEVLRAMKRSTVILERRHKPLAVLLSISQYEQMEARLDWMEERVLGHLAKERAHKTPRKSYLTLEEVEKRLKIH